MEEACCSWETEVVLVFFFYGKLGHMMNPNQLQVVKVPQSREEFSSSYLFLFSYAVQEDFSDCIFIFWSLKPFYWYENIKKLRSLINARNHFSN